MGILRQRITVSVIGLILFGGIGALIATIPVLPHATTTAQASQTDTPTDMPTVTATQPVDATDTVTDVNTPPTATPRATATKTTTATPTTAPGQTSTLRGTIVSIQTSNTVGFTLTLNGGGAKFVSVNGSTQYQGVSDFNALRVNMAVTVNGTIGANSTFTATLVQVHTDN